MQSYWECHEIISRQKKLTLPEQTIAGSLLPFFLFLHFFVVSLKTPNLLAFQESFRPMGLHANMLFCTKEACFWHAFTFLRQLIPGWRTEGFIIWTILVWTLGILTGSSESCQKKSSTLGSSGQQNTEKQWENRKSDKTGNIKVFSRQIGRIQLKIILCTCCCYHKKHTGTIYKD